MMLYCVKPLTFLHSLQIVANHAMLRKNAVNILKLCRKSFDLLVPYNTELVLTE